jgi:hypothetical protein
MSNLTPSELTKKSVLSPSTIETIDGAFLKYVEDLNIFCNTINGREKVPVIWSSAERSFQIKDNKQIRDKNGSLIPPIISIERTSTTKDPNKKGTFQANVSPKNDRVYITKVLNQDKTSNFANADSLKASGQINFVTSKRNKKQVYQHISIPIPIYVTVEYKINIITNYQSQMNEAVQPFMARTAQSYFVISNEFHRYECFMEQEFQQDSIASLGEEERKYKTVITVKVLGYLVGEGDNQEKPQILTTENAVELKIPRENLLLVQEDQKRQREAPSLVRNGGTQTSNSIAVKKTFLIGNGVDSTYQVDHNLNSRDLFVIVRESIAPYSVVEVAIDYTDLNHIDVDMGDIIGSDSYTVTIIG